MIVAVNQSSDISFRIQAFATYHVIRYDARIPIVLDCASGNSQQCRDFFVIKETDSVDYDVMALPECRKRIKRLSGFLSRRDYARMIFIDNLVSHWRFVLQGHRNAPDMP